MILNRLGCKRAIAHKIIPYFPKHDIFIDLFFGAGGIYFYKQKSKYNFLNDLDDDVYNLFRQVLDNKEELVKALEKTPITERQYKEWIAGKREKTDLWNAVRFLVISNYTFYGYGTTLRIGAMNPKKVILESMDLTFAYLQNAYFFNDDFRDVFAKLDYKQAKHRAFCYADPPYLDTKDVYNTPFGEQDSLDLFNALDNSGIKWAMSEFEHPFILEQVEKRDLKVFLIGERTNLKNKKDEILITNYNPSTSLFNLFN